MTLLTEGALVAYLRERAASGTHQDPDLVLGIGDDAALLLAAADQALAWTTDSLVAGVHYPPATHPADIGWKTLAVNLSDLAAMGATPRWVSLNLSLPTFEHDWIVAFCDGFFELAQQHRVGLIGGDCTRAAEAVLTVTAIGQVPVGQALRRDGGQAGDDVWISGWPGEAAAGLALMDNAADPQLRRRLDRPTPRIALGLGLRGLASAALDVSDGLLLDLDRMCAASDCGAQLALEALPISQSLTQAAADPSEARAWLLTGGDDYELLFSAPPARRSQVEHLSNRLNLPLHWIGVLTAGTRVCVRDQTGREHVFARRGYEHQPAR